jgi:hypothetical protein
MWDPRRLTRHLTVSALLGGGVTEAAASRLLLNTETFRHSLAISPPLGEDRVEDILN